MPIEDRQFDVLCAGIIVADHVCRPIAAFPPPGGLALTDAMELTIGGCAANVATDLAKLGRRVALAGCVGDDLFGRHIRTALETTGIDCTQLTISTARETACTMIVNVAGEDRRFIHTLGANAEFTGNELAESEVAAARAVYVGGYGLIESLSPRNVVRLFQSARRHNATTVLDVVLAEDRNYSEWLGCVLPLTDVFLPNREEAAQLIGETDPVRQGERFCADGATTVVVTCGGDGAVLVSNESRLRIPAQQVATIDGTGSGDAFLAGFLHALLAGHDLPTRLKTGTVLGACCVQQPGATTGIPSEGELAQLVADANVISDSIAR